MKVYAAFLVILILSTVIVGQFAAPKDESFSKVDGLVVPWRDSGCNRFAIKFREPGCVLVNGDAWLNSDRLALYDPNATLWFSFSANASAHLTELKTDFVPFAVPYFNVVALRMVAESPHWYEVEVNEKTRETKFALKGEPYWGKTTFAHWIYESRMLTLDNQQNILNRPDGKPMEGIAGLKIEKVNVVKVEGDWVLVRELGNEDGYRGWVRWRKDRDILVGCLLSHDSRWQEAEFEKRN